MITMVRSTKLICGNVYSFREIKKVLNKESECWYNMVTTRGKFFCNHQYKLFDYWEDIYGDGYIGLECMKCGREMALKVIWVYDF